jgi:hypothetical protein
VNGNKNDAQQRFQEMARLGIYQKLERFLIKSFFYICEGLVLVHRHFLKPRNVVCNAFEKRRKTENRQNFQLLNKLKSIKIVNLRYGQKSKVNDT